MQQAEVTKIAKSAWGYTERGENRFGQHGAWFPEAEVDLLVAEQDAFILLAYLRAKQGPDSDFHDHQRTVWDIWLGSSTPLCREGAANSARLCPEAAPCHQQLSCPIPLAF